MTPPPLTPPHLLCDARVYLSGPMDFVASREEEKTKGWRNRIGQFLRRFGVTVFDPWFKPEIRGLQEYGREDDTDSPARAGWTFADSKTGAAQRAACADQFWPALHVDLRMVDTSDFVIAFCPTNVYSVGTPHEIILCRQQRKPVLFVSPPVEFPALAELQQHLAGQGDVIGTRLLNELQNQVPIKANAAGVPSQWYMPLVGGEHFFDGFGFYLYRDLCQWELSPLDEKEQGRPPQKPLLPFLARLNDQLPPKWDARKNDFVANDDWLLWELTKHNGGASVQVDHGATMAPR